VRNKYFPICLLPRDSHTTYLCACVYRRETTSDCESQR